MNNLYLMNNLYNYIPAFFILSLEKIYFLLTLNLFLIKTGYILIDFDVIIPMLSSEFTKSLNFGSKKKSAKKS